MYLNPETEIRRDIDLIVKDLIPDDSYAQPFFFFQKWFIFKVVS